MSDFDNFRLLSDFEFGYFNKRKLSEAQMLDMIASAERHIKHKRYYLARRLLKDLHHPQAHQLLEQLDEIAPVPEGHICLICNGKQFKWKTVLAPTQSSESMLPVEVGGLTLYARICGACSNVQMFLDMPEDADVT